MAAGTGGDRRMMSEINVTPLVDVMLVLLIVFMVTAPMLQSGIDVQLPTAGTAPLDSGERAVTITVDRNGVIHLNKHAFNIDDFRKRAPVILSELGGRPVYIRGDSRISYGDIVSTMSILKGAPDKKAAMAYLDYFYASTDTHVPFMRDVQYATASKSAIELMKPEERDLYATSPANYEKLVKPDFEWIGAHRDELRQRWTAWLTR